MKKKNKITNILETGRHISLFFRQLRRYRKELLLAVKEGGLEDRKKRCRYCRDGLSAIGLDYSYPSDDELYAHYPCVFVANHQSYLDAAILCAVFERNIRFLAKSSVFRVPLLGEIMEHEGHLKVYRGKAAKRNIALRDQIAEAVSAGDGICFFPEGTRSVDGNLQSFKLGAFFAAVQHKLAVVPIVFEGTGKALPKGAFKLSPHDCSMQVLPPHYPNESIEDERERAERLRDEVRAAMQEKLEATTAES
ncbi:MAG: lysophospholipid acyltransferase family protein [Bradymonadales bacterium]